MLTILTSRVWDDDASCRAALRNGVGPGNRNDALGFRVAAVPSQKTNQEAEPGGGGEGGAPPRRAQDSIENIRLIFPKRSFFELNAFPINGSVRREWYSGSFLR